MAYYFYTLRFSRREMPTSVVDAARNPVSIFGQKWSQILALITWIVLHIFGITFDRVKQ